MSSIDPYKRMFCDIVAMKKYLDAHPTPDEHLNTFLVGLLNTLINFANSKICH